jgi:subtilisin family serine protease
MWTNPGETPGNGVDDDQNGLIDDVYGYDFANGDANPLDDHGHGTHVAATVAGDKLVRQGMN